LEHHLIVVVKKAGKAVIAADTMSSFGDTKVSAAYTGNRSKIVKCGDTYLGLAGASAHNNVFRSIVNHYGKTLSFKDTDDIFETYRKLHMILKDEYFVIPTEGEKDTYESSQIDALITNPFGIFGMYTWREVYKYERFWALGSGFEYAMGALHAVYDNDLNAEAIAEIGINAACEFDNGSGLPLIMHTVTLKQPMRKTVRRKQTSR
jgi:ATP-dependent protease HslVU (ClpYQ) peptidase subunit